MEEYIQYRAKPRNAFDKQYTFIWTTAQDTACDRITGNLLSKSDRTIDHVIIGKTFKSCFEQNFWTRFMHTHPFVMFGLCFVNNSFFRVFFANKVRSM